MSSQVQQPIVVAGPDPQPLLRFFSRRRIAISLVGFTALAAFNVLIRRTIPHNPFDFSDGTTVLAGAILLSGLAIRSWSAGTLNKSRELTTSGPYAVTRNPLYIGSFLMMFAFCLVCRDWPTLLFVLGPMSFVYYQQVRMEEGRLAGLFPQQWSDYCLDTPRLFPRKLSAAMWTGWSANEWLRNREYRAIMATAAGWLGVLVWYLVRTRIG